MRSFVRFVLFGTIFVLIFTPILTKIFAYGKKIKNHGRFETVGRTKVDKIG